MYDVLEAKGRQDDLRRGQNEPLERDDPDGSGWKRRLESRGFSVGLMRCWRSVKGLKEQEMDVEGGKGLR